MRLGKGLVRDRADHPWRKLQRDGRDLLGAAHVGVKRTPGTIVSLRNFEPPTFNQLGCEGCTGHAWSLGIVVALAAQGASLDFVPSPLGIYTLARCIGRPVVDIPLTDDGAMLSDVAQAVSQWGIRPIGPLNPAGNTDVTSANVNSEPAFAELEADAKGLITGEYRLDMSALTTVDDVCALIDANIPIARASFVDTAYETFVKGEPAVGVPDTSDQNGGGHATITTGYRVNADSSIDFEDKTSWGDIGDAGHVWISSACLLASWECWPLTVRRAA